MAPSTPETRVQYVTAWQAIRIQELVLKEQNTDLAIWLLLDLETYFYDLPDAHSAEFVHRAQDGLYED
jgi:hypothetical protein